MYVKIRIGLFESLLTLHT